MDGLGSLDSFVFEGFRFDLAAGGLFRTNGSGVTEPVALGSRALALLALFVERPGQLVSKDDIFAAAWSGTIVGENNLSVQISALRRVLDRDRTRGSCIQTIPGRGYRFIPAVTRAANNIRDGVGVYREHSAGPAQKPLLVSHEPLRLPDKPSVAVLPFTNMSGDPEQEYFADGMVEEIITALSRIRWLFVLARNSSFTYKGQAVDVKQVGRELGVRYVLEGSVRKGGNRVRIAGQLIDAATGAHLWADRFDGSLDDVFELQDNVASSVAGVIEPAVQSAETARSAGRLTNDLTAYDLYLRANAMALSSARQVPEALRLMEQAIARDPLYGAALAYAAVYCFRLDDQSEDRETDRLKGIDFARRALDVADDDPGILAHAALALGYFGEDIGAMMALADRALALNPHFARGWHVSGNLRFWAGQPDIAIEHCEAALRLSPRSRVGTPLTVIGGAHFFARRFDAAVPKLLLALEEDPTHPSPHRFLAACYASMGRFDDAREIVGRLRAIPQVVIPDFSFLRSAEHRELLLSGLRLAMDDAE